MLIRLLLRGAGRTMALMGLWGRFPGEVGGELAMAREKARRESYEQKEPIELGTTGTNRPRPTVMYNQCIGCWPGMCFDLGCAVLT
jgi:hypothetical protein